MTTCSYGNVDGHRPTRVCRQRATFVAETRTRRQFCSHHAAIAEALGWRVYSVTDAQARPRYDQPANARPSVRDRIGTG